ncbi:hypothetical protein LTR84_005534 [Exophiala bonariae]|uniref:Uncharacterized protein n=1 Tax=Exophiala bonariae TaxID=1690606 RepID=A0AAV9N7H4_9EURO|nr:hypothetical protein LTR84_005534 [Exophiala bonariae]
MAQPTSAHSSFVYLVENIPDWQKEVDVLAARTLAKNGEFKAEYLRLVNQIKPRRRKSPSLASIHTLDDLEQPTSEHVPSIVGGTDSSDVPSPPDRIEIDPLEAGNRHIYAQARRIRKPGPSVRSGASGPLKIRNKNQVVVYYDSFVQERLDTLVKQLGSGRNNLRKGKNALVAAKGFQLPRLSRAAVRNYDSIDDIRSILASRSNPALPGGKKSTTASQSNTSDHESTFFQVDKELESIQSLCEVAAHQFLRDGDCQIEMITIKQKLGELLTRATSFAETLKVLDDQQLQQGAKLDADNRSLVSDNSHHDSDGSLSVDHSFLGTPKLMAHKPFAINHTLDDMKARGAFFSGPDTSFGTNALVADNIEVDDDSEQEDIMVDVAAFRLAKARQARV